MFNLHINCLLLVLVLIAASCGDSEKYRFGFNTTGIEFKFFERSEGIHPSKATLFNPNNPFREFAIGSETKFEILDDGGNAGAFYAWAVVLANEPTGENQYYTATKLRDMFLSGELAEEDRGTVRDMAIEGFQRVLDCFPDSVFFDVTGTFPRKLATPAYLEIVELGARVEGDWVLTRDVNGNPLAVRNTGFDPQAREVRCF